MKWVKKGFDEYSCTFRYAGGLIAEIRGEGNCMDWYCSYQDGVVSEEIEKALGSLGWTYREYEI